MIRRPPRSTLSSSSAASDVYKRQPLDGSCGQPPSQPAPGEGVESMDVPGEIPMQSLDVCWGWGDTGPATSGTLTVSNFALRLTSAAETVQIPLAALEKVDLRTSMFRPELSWWCDREQTVLKERPVEASEDAARVVVDIRHRRGMHIVVYLPMPMQQSVLEDSLIRFAFPGKLTNLFAFSFRPTCKPTSSGVLSRAQHFEYLGLPESSKWRVTHVNTGYNLCPTYSEVLVVPASVTDADVEKAARFRTSTRFPNLCWMDKRTGVGLCRSSQPKTGVFGHQSRDDQEMIAALAATTVGDQPMLVLDCRPAVNAYANAVAGGGYENSTDYPGIDFQFLDIANIHAVRTAHHQLRQAASSSCPPCSVQASDWTSLLSVILVAAVSAVESIGAGVAVLVHCSDGWDRTPQVCTLAMIMMDPFYRTPIGFATLVEQEWVNMGHQFNKRHGFGSDQADNSQRSPIFLQWLDCVWQIMSQNVGAFEFGEDLLLRVYDAVESCQFGNFLFDCERERVETGAGTCCAWDWLLLNLDAPGTQPTTETVIAVEPLQLRLWSRMHLQRWGNSPVVPNGQPAPGMLESLATNGTAMPVSYTHLTLPTKRIV
eukprot:TRINITY_DN7377_c0_g2_i3.p1 TRINITY_DN7377_c0_g2~~TRINITY_DN7377_c0_g2_i3.p1  ORF type:complete len:599 (+),score=132.52 TRINITY_DN7377_c0_g2_i3:105-1901(+)